MPISHDTKWFGVNDARIRKITTDPTGGVTTYGPRIDVPGIKSVGISGDVNSNELRGDGQRLDFDANLAGLSLSFEFAKKSLDLFATLVGGTVVDAGTTPAQSATWTLTGGDKLGYFEFEAVTTNVDSVGGDGHIILHKAIITGFPEIGNAEEDYRTYTVEAGAMRLNSNNALLTVVVNETAVPIPA